MKHKQIAGLVFASFALAAGAPACAWDQTRPGLRVALSADFFRAEGAMVASARYGGAFGLKLGAWVRDNNVTPHAPKVIAGGDYVLTASIWRFGAGIAWIDGENNINGTRWNFDLSIACDLSKRIFLQYQHYSHGSGVGIDKDASNSSWNLLGLGYLF